MSAPKRKRRGRPKGSKNREYKPISTLPAVCDKCGHDLTDVPQVVGSQVTSMTLPVTLPTGEIVWGTQKWIRKQCPCGQYFSVKEIYAK